MWNLSNRSVGGICLLALVGCAAPSTEIKQPLTARPSAKEILVTDNGAIFQAGQNERPLFEDRRARNVGDVLIINIAETTSASGKSSSGADHSGSIAVSTPTITGNASGQVLAAPFGATARSSGKLSDKNDSAGNNAFSGTITVTVIEVLANGNLLVSGEKQVTINQANEYIRFSGVVNPSTISGTNTVLSTQVADAQIEYKGATKIDMSTITSMFGKAFQSVMPF